jgi:hypothetical protein
MKYKIPFILFLILTLVYTPVFPQGKGGKKKSDMDLPVAPPSGKINPKPDLPEPPPEPPEPEEDPPEFAGEPIPSSNSTLVYVIDVSCSMSIGVGPYVDDEGNTTTGKNRLDRAKAEIRRSIRDLPKNFKFNIIDYDCTMMRWKRKKQLASVPNKLSAIGYVDAMRIRGGTGTGFAVALGLADKEVKSLILLTDGYPGCYGGDAFNRHAQMIKAANTQNAIITVFGVGAAAYGPAGAFCKRIARENGGNFIGIN